MEMSKTVMVGIAVLVVLVLVYVMSSEHMEICTLPHQPTLLDRAKFNACLMRNAKTPVLTENLSKDCGPRPVNHSASNPAMMRWSQCRKCADTYYRTHNWQVCSHYA
jgi:hypothetical protein